MFMFFFKNNTKLSKAKALDSNDQSLFQSAVYHLHDALICLDWNNRNVWVFLVEYSKNFIRECLSNTINFIKIEENGFKAVDPSQ